MRRFKHIVAVIPAGLLLASCAELENEEVDQAEDAIQGGTDDVVMSGGRVVDDVRQWARDASVSVELFNAPWCSGTLISPRVVLTNAHCIRGNPVGDFTVKLGPRADGIGTPPAGTPSSVSVGVIDCVTHPGASAMCNDGGDPNAVNIDRDLAALILDQRLDVGLSGARDSAYPVVPARVVPNDPSNGIGGDPALWTGRTVRHVGYSRTSEGPGAVFPILRQVASQHVSTGSLHVNGWSAVLQLWGDHGVPGDSGGGVFLEDGDIAPLNLLAVHRGEIGDVDTAVRLTWGGSSSIQAWLASLVGPHPSYGGTSFTTSSGLTVWTGDTQVPPRSEPIARTAVTNADTLDPDGDGLVGSNDNCWGVSNIRQEATDPTATFTCTDSLGAVQTFTCMTTDGTLDPDGDGIVNACDNCDNHPNSRQDDCDSNGVGDACEANTDGDHIPAGCDNCPTVNNPSQSNCNADGEIAGGLPERGDACDPHPCAAADARASSDGSRVYTEGLTGVGLGANPFALTRGIGTGVTGFRWCPCSASDAADSASWRAECAEDFGCVVDSAEYADPTSSWRKPTLSFTTHTPNAAGEITLRFTNAAAMPGARTDGFSGAWNMVADATAAGVLSTIDLFGLRTDWTQAVFWSSVRAWAPVAPESVTWCTATTSSGCTPIPSDGTSHYWSGLFRKQTGTSDGTFVADLMHVPDLRDFFTFEMCPECSASFPEMFVSLDDACGSPPCDVIGRLPDAFPQKGPYDIPLSIEPAQLAIDLTKKGFEWVPAGQANDSLPLEAARVIALERTEQGLWLRQIVRSPASGVPYGTLPSGFANAPLDDVDRYAGAVPVLDGQRSKLYFIGGVRSGSAPNPWIHVVDLNGGERRVPLNRPWAGNVVAAALDPFNPYLVAIERSQNSFRIVRINIDTGAVTVARTFGNSAKTAKHSLVSMPDGRFAVASTDLYTTITRVVVFGWTPNGFMLSQHASTANRLESAGAVSASPEGISIAATPSGSTLWRPVGLRYSTFKSGTKDADLALLF